MIKSDHISTKVQLTVIMCIISLLCCFSALLRVQDDTVLYHNYDATWHTLLTVQAYSETPISDHLFLPIVSLGKETDKNIPWGATIPDDKGNYYYTSFSPAGYVAPYLFFKVLGLEVTEQNLYLYNSILYLISALLWVYLLYILYIDSKSRLLLCFIGGLGYITSPEILHGMGIVFWHQSLMQVTFLVQVISYVYIRRSENNIAAKWVFYLTSLINPYIEWTGYVANVGFALAELISGWKENKKKAFGKAVILGFITLASMLLFIVHYLLRVDSQMFFQALYKRFMARNVTASTSFLTVASGYLLSFLYIWILMLVLLVWCFVKNGKVELKNGIMFLILGFPLLENLVMKQHAATYTYDRMKAVFILMLFICELVRNICNDEKTGAKPKRMINASVLGITLVFSTLNINSYINNGSFKYVYDAPFRATNKIMAEYVTEKYPNALYATNTSVRGYLNLLFKRGIYENSTLERSAEIANSKNYELIIFIEHKALNISRIGVYTVNMELIDEVCKNDDGKVYLNYIASDLTDVNWTNGIKISDPKCILFSNNPRNFNKIITAKKIICGDSEYTIEQFDYDEKWIRVTVDRDATACGYPSELTFQ